MAGAYVRVRASLGSSRRRYDVDLRPHMSQTAKRHRMTDAERYQAVTAARERFLAGDDRVRGVRPEVATSWYRCREQYHVDPSLSKAPPASALDESSGEHTLEHEIVFAQLGERRGVDRERGREPRRRRHRHRWCGSHPDGPGRQGDAPSRARQQHGAVVVLVGVGDRHERDGHGARGTRTGADQRARALVRGISRVGLCRRGRTRRRDPRCRRGPRCLGLARPPSAPGGQAGCPGRWAARARSSVSARTTAAPSWPPRSPRHERGLDRPSPPWTHEARS